MDRACDFPSIAPAANFTVFNPPGWGRAAYEPPNFIYIFGVEGCWVPVFVETSVSGIHKPEWFYTVLRPVKIEPFIIWSLRFM